MESKSTSYAFKPSRWVPGGHAQTLWRKFAPVKEITHRRERVELSDGDFIDIDWHEKNESNSAYNGTLVLILHGLCGCSKSTYVQSLQYRLGRSGFPSVAMNFRGCSGEVNRLAKSYHSGITEDLAEVFEYVYSRCGDKQIALAGFSLGANVLLKWLGETGISGKASKAVAVSTPFRLSHCSQEMLKGLSRMYGNFFLRRLLAALEEKKAYFQQRDNKQQLEIIDSFGDLSTIKTLWQFDDRVTAPLHNFSSAEDYYSRCSSLQFLHNIQIPTLLIQSNDDPIIPPQCIPGNHEISEHVHIDLSDGGGHVGFASANDRYWLENHIIRFLES